ncbi:Cof-type HAD-IIB family hydrolase [Yoonia vestfoldensis]|uniref:Cof-type HAD-IIB family hydrolase n=1 Tax=Yoonia vestfoldensis TaxID=245188 RepID=UPI0003745E59|nr:Cof-type HAD-IIB family hydrolase [Yoonia vestfoldensis]
MASTLVFDIDGTLINSEKRVLPDNISLLQYLHRAKGVKIILASARAPKSIEVIRSQIEVECGVVAFNGAFCFAYGEFDVNSSAHLSTPLGFEEISLALEVVKGKDLTASLFSRDDWFANREDYWLKREIRGTGLRPDKIGQDCLLELAAKKSVYKLMFRGAEAAVSQALADLKASCLTKAVNLFSDRPTIIEISPISASKYQGVVSLIDAASSDFSDVLVFGDADNDLEMISKFSNSVAMGNGSIAVKKAARFVIEDNNAPSIANFLTNWFREK